MLRTPGPSTGMPVEHLNLRGGRLCLDFVNTVDPRWVDDNRDDLDSYPALVAWGVHAGALTLDEVDALRRQGETRTAETAAALAAAIELREALYRLFSAADHGAEPSPDDLAVVNAAVGRALAHARLVPDGDGFAWGWEDDERALDRVLWPVTRSAADLLTSADLGRVHAC